MDSGQMNQLRKISADEYRKKHGLLTSAEITQYRKRLDMSQIQFAEYLNVGEASIKRWETFFIQDKIQDDHIRLKCDNRY
jgi:DNA-binding transcriptional regulator YiaG